MDNDFCPWATAEAMGVRIELHPLIGANGCTNGTDTIWIDPRLTEVEKRMTLIHELVHVCFGHVGYQTPATEDMVRAYTARFILNWDQILQYAEYQATPFTIAEELGVTVDVLQDRIHHATHEELATLHALRTHQWA